MESDPVLDSESVNRIPGQETAAPPPAPPLPPPVPPPVAYPARTKDHPSTLWRWNDRLAIAAGGLTLLLIGVFVGRSFGPAAPSDGQSEAISSWSMVNHESVASVEEENSGEVNPPALAISLPSAPPTSAPAVAEPTGSQQENAVSAIPSEPAALPKIVAVAAPAPVTPAPPASEPASSPSAAPAEATAPAKLDTENTATTLVSLEGKVATIEAPPVSAVCAPGKKFKDRKLNTALTWAESATEAAQQAEEEQKLVFLIHVSGNFELPGFT